MNLKVMQEDGTELALIRNQQAPPRLSDAINVGGETYYVVGTRWDFPLSQVTEVQVTVRKVPPNLWFGMDRQSTALMAEAALNLTAPVLKFTEIGDREPGESGEGEAVVVLSGPRDEVQKLARWYGQLVRVYFGSGV